MKHKIIQTENYLLIVDDSQITEGDYCLANAKTYNNEIVTYRKSPCPPPFVSNLNILKKIIAHLPLNGASILNGVDLLPPLEDDIELLIPFPSHKLRDGSEIKTWMNGWEEGHKEGYNKAKEQFRYTEEDLRKANRMGIQKNPYAFDGKEPKYKYSEDEIIKSLQQPKYPIGVECEVINCDKCVYVQGGNLSPDCCNELNPKTATNSQGITQWVGKYIFK
jgi:hypothetical protein